MVHNGGQGAVTLTEHPDFQRSEIGISGDSSPNDIALKELAGVRNGANNQKDSGIWNFTP